MKPPKCPRCGRSDIRGILYGRPTAEGFAKVQAGEWVLGDCVPNGTEPDWYCAACSFRWFDPDDPAWQERQTAIARFFDKAQAEAELRNEKIRTLGPNAVRVRNDGLVHCPVCRWRFWKSDKSHWDGHMHRRCGTPLRLFTDQDIA